MSQVPSMLAPLVSQEEADYLQRNLRIRCHNLRSGLERKHSLTLSKNHSDTQWTVFCAGAAEPCVQSFSGRLASA